MHACNNSKSANNLIDYSLLVGLHEFRPAWRPGYDYAVGDCVYPRGFDYKGLRFRCELEGKSGDMEPTWPIVDSPTQHHKIIGTAFTEQGRIYWRCEKEESDVQHLSISEAVNLLWAATPTEILFFGIIDIVEMGEKAVEKNIVG